MGKFRDSFHNIERNTKRTANSAASAAQSSAATTQATRSAATGVWVGAGFQAAAAFQSARAARAAEEQRELQRARNEQDKLYQFAMWSQTTRDGAAFVTWREQAVSLAQLLRNRDAEWLSAWARAIGRAQMETTEDEKHRFLRHPARLKQAGLRIAVILSFVIAAFYAVSFTLQTLVANTLQLDETVGGYTYEQCLTDLQDPDNFLINEADCEAISPHAATLTALFPLMLFLGLGVIFVALRHIRIRAAKADLTVPSEAQSRIERWGFDPLAVRPGYAASTWYQSQGTNGYADRLMQLALHGHASYPTESQLIPLAVPKSWPPTEGYPVEVNNVLEKFLLERPQLG